MTDYRTSANTNTFNRIDQGRLDKARAQDDISNEIIKALILESVNKKEESLAAFNKIIDLHPKDWSAHYDKGRLLASMGRKEEAIKAFDKAASIDPEQPHAYYEKAMIVASLGRKDEALKLIDKAIELGQYEYFYEEKGRILGILKK